MIGTRGADVRIGPPVRGKDLSSRAAKGRCCSEPGCTTILSTYNASPTLAAADAKTPPMPAASDLRNFRRPVLLIAGEADAYCPAPALEELGLTLPSCEISVLPGTDHFLWRREREAAGIVGAFATRVLGPAGAGPAMPPP